MAEKTTISELSESAEHLIELQRYSEVLPILQSILILDPNNEDAAYGIGVTFTRLKKYVEAIDAYDRALTINQNNSRIWNMKGMAYSFLGKHQEAVDSYNKSISINPDSEDAWNNKGVAQSYLGKPQDAIDSYNKAIAINPSCVKAWYSKGDALRELGRYQEALEACDKAISIDPNNCNVWNNKAAVFFYLGKYHDALDAYNKAISIDPNSANAWNNKEYVLRKLGRNQEALEAHNKAITITQNITATVGNGDRNTSNSQEPAIYTKPKKTFVPPIPPKKESDLKGFASVAGMNKLKEQLQKEVIAVLKNPEKYRKFDVGLPNGILLFGPPGCGKTFIVQKLAEELGYNFMEVPPSSVGSKFIHQTSANIAKIFQDAKDKAPTILFFDEFEALVPKRESLGSEGQFKNEEINEFLQHLNNASKDNILVVGATNQPTLIDSGITRSGRFDRIIYVGPPDHDARKELFKIGLTKAAKSDDIDYDELAAKTDNYSSSDITLIVQDAKRLAADQELDEINQALLIYAVEKSKPSLTKSQIEKYIALAKDER